MKMMMRCPFKPGPAAAISILDVVDIDLKVLTCSL